MRTGLSPGSNVPPNVAVESDKLNTLANVLSPCVVASTACSSLFLATTPNGGAPPTNTIAAILSIVQHPANNVAAISALSTGVLFQPSLSSVPSDWTLAITLTGGGMNGPTALAIDGSGNVWTANYFNVLSAFAPGGLPIFPSGITGSGLHESYGMAIDAENNVWVANNETPGINRNGGTVSKFTNSGLPLSGPLGYIAGGIYYPVALASDVDGSMWVANFSGASVTLLTSTGAASPGVCNPAGCGFTSASLGFPDAIAVDADHFAWVASQSTGTVTRISPDGTQMTAVNCCARPAGLAIDGNGYVWAANYAGNSVSQISNAGTVVSNGHTGGGLNHPQGIAIDGAGSVWVTNYQGASFSELAGSSTASPGTALSPSTGLGMDANLVTPYAIAIDASGSVWISNFAQIPTPGQQGTLTQFVGLATPVKTPLVGPARIP